MRHKSGSNYHIQKNRVVYKDIDASLIEERKQEVVSQFLIRLFQEKNEVWERLMKELPKMVEDHY